MPEYLLRKFNSVQPDELEQIKSLIYAHYGKNTNEAFLDWRLSAAADFSIVLAKNGNTVDAVSFYHTSKELTPFSKRKVLIIQFGIALKREGYSGNVIWKMGKWYARKVAGIFYPLKRVVGVSAMCNPRVYENFIRLYPTHFPGIKGNTAPEVNLFLKNYTEKRNFPFSIDEDHCYQDDYLNEFEVTDKWVKYIGARNTKVNQLFLDKTIIKYDNGRYFKTGKHMLVCGYRSPFRFDYHIWKKPKSDRSTKS